MLLNTKLVLYFPQWQGSGDDDMIFRGSETLKSVLGNELNVDLTAIGVPLQIETEDEQVSQKESHWIRNYNILSLYHRHAVNTITAHSPKRIFTLGGDCGIEFAPIRYLNSLYGGDLAVVWLDAHADLNTPSTSPSKTFHGMVLRALLEPFEVSVKSPGEHETNLSPDFVTSSVTPLLQPKQVLLAGVRDMDPPEEEYIGRQDIAVVECEELERHQGKTVVNMLRRRGFSKVYIHIDADVLSLDEFSSVMCPTAGGIRIQTLKEVIKDIKEADGVSVVGGSLVEVTNAKDDNVPYRDMARIFASLWLE